MRIGLLTFHNAYNIGAVLQASALLEYLNKKDYRCEIVDFYPNNIKKNSRIKNLLITIKRTFLFFISRNIRINRYEKYKNKYYVRSKKQYYGDDEIFSSPPSYDILISGSDQIFNMTLTNNTLAYYLGFSDTVRKITYASSFGRVDISMQEKCALKNEIYKFYSISVREKSAGDIIKQETGFDSTLVLDPVFLLDKSIWESRCNEKMHLPNKYIFVYSMESSDALQTAVKVLEEECDLPIIFVRGGGSRIAVFGNEDKKCGPSEFLRYVRDAEFVVTNSFHGVAFSMIFRKKFLCIAHSTRNTRLENILELASESDKIIRESVDNIRSKIIEGEKCIFYLDEYIKASKKYLLDNVFDMQN